MADEFEATTGVRRGRSVGWSPMENMMGVRKSSTFVYDHDNDDNDHPSSPSVICDNNNDNSMVFLDFQDKPYQYPLQDFSVTSSSCSTYDWNNNQVLIDTGNERSESNYNSLEQEDVTNYRHTDWSSASRNYPLIGAKKEEDGLEDYSSTMAKCAQGLLPTTITNFPMNNSLSSNSYHSSYVQSLFEHDHDHDLEPQPQPSFYNNYQFSPSSSKLSPNFTKPLTSKHLTSNNLHTANNLPFWTGVVDASSFHPQIINPAYEEKPNLIKPVKSSNNEPTFKRPRIETPSPLPTFKVRKEKLGDRITALQQLVSPFGKTDTASVLHEAIEYIKFLHDQVGVLSSPYMQSASQNVRTQQMSRKMKDSEATKQDLRTRGLCLVPISSTYPVANETASDFWTPTFGGTFR